MGFDFVKSFERVKTAVSLLEAIEYNDAAHKALRELRPLLGSLEVQVSSLKEEGVDL